MPEQSHTEPAPDRQVFTFAQMVPTGVLWLINRTVFHPRGLALGLTIRHEDGEQYAEGWGIIASPDGTPYRYDEAPEEARRHQAVEELIDLAKRFGVMPPPLPMEYLPGPVDGETPVSHDDAPWGPCCSRTDPHEHFDRGPSPA